MTREARDDSTHAEAHSPGSNGGATTALAMGAARAANDAVRVRGKNRNARRPRAAAATTNQAELSATLRPHTIMVIEDDIDLRDGIAYLLEACGYEVIPAADGEEGLEHLRRGTRPCLILLDLLMPRKDGFQFRLEQVETEAFAAIPTIAYSGIYTGSGLRERAQAVGISTVIEKPVDYDTLLDIVERHCTRP